MSAPPSTCQSVPGMRWLKRGGHPYSPVSGPEGRGGRPGRARGSVCPSPWQEREGEVHMGTQRRAAVSQHTPVTRDIMDDDLGPTASGLGQGGLPQSGLLQGGAEAAALSVSVHGRGWLFPGCPLRVTGARVTGTLGRRETPPDSGRERAWPQAVLWGTLWESPELSPSHRLRCSWSATASFCRTGSPAPRSPGAASGCLSQEAAQKRGFFSTCGTAALSKSKQCCSLFRKGQENPCWFSRQRGTGCSWLCLCEAL